jgi:nucleoside-diphosphate-sugar epimerase
MSKPVALVTGAGGEIGRLLVPALKRQGFDVVALDLNTLPPGIADDCVETLQMDIADIDGLRSLFARRPPDRVFHLAALLSSHAERNPFRAHAINVDATLALYRLCRETRPVRFLFPSSIAVYGLPDGETKAGFGPVREWQWNTPTSIYGCNKLYCELVGTYQCNRIETNGLHDFDFRSIRFPGLISAETLPSGGSSDYAPQMIHAAAKGEPDRCFVSEDTTLPFLTMPDAVAALLKLADADASTLGRRVYNIKGFSCSAGEIRREVLKHFPDAEISFESNPAKQAIVDTWPADVDDSKARRDWGFSHEHGLAEALGDYLVPALRQRYAEIAAERNPAD